LVIVVVPEVGYRKGNRSGSAALADEMIAESGRLAVVVEPIQAARDIGDRS
jgi:hypothetical protein